MPDSDKSPGQAVEQKPSDKFHRSDGDRFGAVFFSVFGAKGHHGVFEGFDAAVGNRHPVGVASQIFKDVLGLFDRIAHRDHPCFGKQGVFDSSSTVWRIF